MKKLHSRLVLIVISGKRFSGKDTFATMLSHSLDTAGVRNVIRKTSYALKEEFCKNNAISLYKLESEREYKEKYRKQLTEFVVTKSKKENMILFTDMLYKDSLFYDCVIVSDIRTVFDLRWLRQHFKLISIRINANDDVRAERGYVPSDYDLSVLENELDYETFDYSINNNGSVGELQGNIIEVTNILISKFKE
jgi:phosphomevalonate kinase